MMTLCPFLFTDLLMGQNIFFLARDFLKIKTCVKYSKLFLKLENKALNQRRKTNHT